MSASPLPMLALTRSEPNPLIATVARVRSRLARVETGVERRDTSQLAKQRGHVFDSHPTSVLECAYSQFPGMLMLAGFHIPPGTPPPPIVSQRDPLVLLDKPRRPSLRPSKIIIQQCKVSEEVLPPTKEFEDVGFLLSAKSVNSATEIDRCGRPIAKLGNGGTQNHPGWVDTVVGMVDLGRSKTTGPYLYADFLVMRRRPRLVPRVALAKGKCSSECSPTRKYERRTSALTLHPSR